MPRRVHLLRLFRWIALGFCVLLVAAWLFSLLAWVDYVGPNSRVYLRHGVIAYMAFVGPPNTRLPPFVDRNEYIGRAEGAPRPYGWHLKRCRWLNEPCAVSPSWWALCTLNTFGYGEPAVEYRDFGSGVIITGANAVVYDSAFEWPEPGQFITRYELKSDRLKPISGRHLFYGISPDRSTLPASPISAYDLDVLGIGGWEVDWPKMPDEETPWALATSGEFVVLGYPAVANEGSGSAFVFTLLDDEWGHQQELIPSKLDSDNSFGWNVAMDRKSVFVAAPESSAGVVSVFQRDAAGEKWRCTQTIEPPNGNPGDAFGRTMALQPGIAAILSGAAKRTTAYVYRYDETQWVLEQELPISGNPAGTDDFPDVAAISHDTLMVSAGLEGRNPLMQGAGRRGQSPPGNVYVFRCVNHMWCLSQVLNSPESNKHLLFGATIALRDGLALISSLDDGWSNDEQPGRVYVYRDDGKRWHQTQELTPVVEIRSGAYSVGIPAIVLAAFTLVLRRFETWSIRSALARCILCGEARRVDLHGRCGPCQQRQRRGQRRWAMAGAGCCAAMVVVSTLSAFYCLEWRSGVWTEGQGHLDEACTIQLQSGDLKFGSTAIYQASSGVPPNIPIPGGSATPLVEPGFRWRLPSLEDWIQDWEIGLPTWVLVLLGSVWTCWMYRRSRQPPVGHCAGCGYNLTGNQSGICPECGLPCAAEVPSERPVCVDGLKPT